MTDPAFNRRLHLTLAVVALGHGPIGVWTIDVLPTLGVFVSPEASTIIRLVHLCFAAFVAWLAFAVFDTNAGITVLPKRWCDVGWRLLATFAIAELVMVIRWATDPPTPAPTFIGDQGELLIGWMVASLLAGSAAEEIVYRTLLQRALEGYMHRLYALALQAMVFHFVHVYVYGYGHGGGFWYFAGLFYGWAFLRTRSLAVPTILHTAHNVLFFSMGWYFR
jgi:membrane protease YdiL (CAAX protease family)